MTTHKPLHSSGSARTIEDGETYYHIEQGYVEATGIWHATQRLDTVQETDIQDRTVVRYVPAEDGEWIDERAESLANFLEAIA